jgi:superfamily II DNA helicase RecQ
MAASVPTTERELLAIFGIGPVKLERYGATFLELLRAARD